LVEIGIKGIIRANDENGGIWKLNVWWNYATLP